jgi:adenine-specific DNA-methyltransferase
MNADLLMGDDLLKKTGAGNLFMVFGEPDIDVTEVIVDPDGPDATVFGKCIQVELKGLDVYDPTTGEIRSNSTDDIACWFIDTDYNGESFFVRHVYFVGAQVTDKKDGQKYDPYRALRSTLRSEIDMDAWHSIYSTVSRPFAVPTSGKFAVKVINHYGDEVLKVYDVE